MFPSTMPECDSRCAVMCPLFLQVVIPEFRRYARARVSSKFSPSTLNKLNGTCVLESLECSAPEYNSIFYWCQDNGAKV